MQNWLSRVKAVTTSTGPGDLVIGAALDGTWRTFASALDGEIVDVLVEHESLAEKEVGAYRYDHATTTLQRASTGAVEWSTAGAATKATFSAGNKHVSIDVNAGSLRGFALYRGSGRTLVEDTDWTAGGTFSVSLTNPTHRSVVVSGVASGALAQAMTVALPAASGGEWGDEVYVEKAATAGAPTVTVTGPAAPLALKAPGDWLVAKIVGTTAKAWAVRARGNAEMAEDTVAGALTVDGRLIDRMQLYTGAGHTWTINTAARAGVVPVANEGSGPITVTAGTATLSGDPEIPAGSKGMVVYTQAGAQARVLSELMRATTGSSAGTPFTTSVPFSIRKVLASTGPIPASAFGIWPDSGADETTRIGTALTALAGEGPNPVTGRKRSLGFVNGTYLVSNLADATTVKCVGENGTVFQYNGAAGAGTFIWKITIAGGDPRVTYGKFRGVKFNGTAPGGAMAEAGLWFATAPDWSTLLDTCHFFGIGLYAVRLAGATNFYAYDCRCDAVGASMFRVEGEPTRQNLIAVIRGTCTWNDPGNLVNWVNQGYIAAGAVGGVAAYWGRSVVELLHTGGAGGGSFVALRDYNVEWHFAGDPAGSGIVLDRNASTNVNRPNRLLIQNIRGFTDDTHQIVGFTGTDNRQPIVTAHQASQDGGGARPVFDFTRSLAFGNAFSTSFKWGGAGRFFAENGGPMLGTAAARPAANTWLRGERYFATDTGLESLCDGTAWIDSSAGTGVPTYQAVTASAAQAGYQVTRTSAHIRVELTEDLTATGTFALPTSPIDGDVVTVVRNSGGFFDWTNAATSTVLGYREDLAVFQRASGAWKRISLRGRAGARRESAGRDLLLADNGATIAVTAVATYNLPAAAGTSTGFRCKLVQRGSGAITLTLDGALTQVGGGPLTTSGDGQALVIEALGSSQVQVSRLVVDGNDNVVVVPLTSILVNLAAADFATNNYLGSLNLAGNQFVYPPTGVASGKLLQLDADEGGSGEKVIMQPAGVTLKAQGLTPPVKIAGPGRTVALLSTGGGGFKVRGPIDVATTSPPGSPTLADPLPAQSETEDTGPWTYDLRPSASTPTGTPAWTVIDNAGLGASFADPSVGILTIANVAAAQAGVNLVIRLTDDIGFAEATMSFTVTAAAAGITANSFAGPYLCQALATDHDLNGVGGVGAPLNLQAGTNRMCVVRAWLDAGNRGLGACVFDQGGANQATMTGLTAQQEGGAGETECRIYYYKIPDGVAAGNKTIRLSVTGGTSAPMFDVEVKNGVATGGVIESGAHHPTQQGETSTLASVPDGAWVNSVALRNDTSGALSCAGGFTAGNRVTHQSFNNFSLDYRGATASRVKSGATANFVAQWDDTTSASRVSSVAAAFPKA